MAGWQMSCRPLVCLLIPFGFAGRNRQYYTLEVHIMAMKALPHELYPFLADAVIAHGSYEPAHLLPLMEAEIKQRNLTDTVTEAKLRTGTIGAVIIKLCSEQPDITKEDLTARVNALGLNVSLEALVIRVTRLQADGHLPQTFPWATGTSVGSVTSDRAERLFEAAREMLADEMPRRLETAHAWMRKHLDFSELTDHEIDEAIIRVAMSQQLGKAIITAHEKGLGLEAFQRVAVGNLPRWLIQLVYKASSGATEAPSIPGVHLPGILRLNLQDTALRKVRDVPASSFREPIALLSKRKGRLRVGVINGVHLGVAHATIEENLLRKAFSYAKHTGVNAMVIGGGLFLPEFRRASGSRTRTLESLITGYKLDVEDFPEWYQDDVRKAVRSGLREPIYVTASQRLTSLARGLYKVMVSPHGPEFPGPVYVVLGQREQNLITAVAFYELHYLHVKNVLEAKARLRVSEELGKNAQEELERIAITVKSNIDETVERNVLDLARRAIIKLIERDSKIPNLRIIGSMDAHVRFGKNADIVHFTSCAGTDSFVSVVKEYGLVQKRGELPDLVHVFDPAAAWYRETARENFTTPDRTTPNTRGRSSTLYVQSPMFLDEEVIDRRVAGWSLPANLHPILRARSEPGFNPGMSILSVGGGLPPREEFIETRLIRNLSPKQLVPPKPGDGNGKRKLVRVLPREEYFRIGLMTDIHMGNHNRYLMRLPDKSLGGVTEGFLWLVRLGGAVATLHSAYFLDDLCHGNHFGTHKVIHENHLSTELLVKQAQRFRAELQSIRNRKKREIVLEKLDRLFQEQRYRTGDHELTSQLRAFREMILFNFRDVHQSVLEAYQASSGKYRSVSEVLGNENYYDYDIGPFSFGSGNHVGRTTDTMLNEGDGLADYLRALLFSPDGTKEEMENLRRLIRAYNYQQESIGFGRLEFPTFTYGLELNSSPGKVKGWADVLKGVVAAEAGHGDPVGVLSGVYTIRFYGDKHFHAARYTRDGAYVMGAPDTTTDSYSYKVGRLPPNNTGVTVLYLPVRGPMRAPIMTRFLDAYTLERALQNRPEKFPWRDWHPVNA